MGKAGAANNICLARGECVKHGLSGGALDLFSNEQSDHTHPASLSFMRELGVQRESNAILDLFAGSGMRAAWQSRTVRLSPGMLEAARGRRG